MCVGNNRHHLHRPHKYTNTAGMGALYDPMHGMIQHITIENIYTETALSSTRKKDDLATNVLFLFSVWLVELNGPIIGRHIKSYETLNIFVNKNIIDFAVEKKKDVFDLESSARLAFFLRRLTTLTML